MNNEEEVDLTANNENENQGFVYENSNYEVENSNSNNENRKKALTPAQTLSQLIQTNNLEGVKAFLVTMNQGNATAADLLKKKPFVVEAIKNYDTRSTSGPSTDAAKNAKIILETLVANQFSLTEPLHQELPLNAAASIENESASENALKFLILKAKLPANGEKNKKSPLIDALEKNHFQVADFLIRVEADVNKIVNGTPLLQSLLFEVKNLGAAEFLLNKGADINAQNLIGDTPLHTILKASNLPETYKSDTYSLLLKSPKLVPTIQDSLQRHPLLAAVYQGNLYGIQKMLDSPKEQFNSLVNKGPVEDLSRARWNAAYAQGDRTKTPILIAIKRSSLSPPEAGKNTTKEGLYNEILTELLSKGKLQKGDWNDLFTTLMNQNIDFIEQILYQKQATLLKVLKENNIIDINGVFHGHHTFLTYCISLLESGVTDLETIKMLIDTGANPNLPNQKIQSPMYLAYKLNNQDLIQLLKDSGATTDTLLHAFSKNADFDLVKSLLESGADVNKVTKVNNIDVTAYDVAGDMSIRLLLAQYMEKNEPRFRGFLENDFLKLELLFQDKRTYVICPFCFTDLDHRGGCMYIFEHNCSKTRKKSIENQDPFVPIIHEKLYNRFKDKQSDITVCYHCNRAGYTWPERTIGGQQLVGHAHIKLGIVDPIHMPEQAPKKPDTYYDKSTCIHQGGGGPNEKMIRFQVLMNFLCYLNEHFVGKISNIRAHLLAREMFWEAPLYDGTYLTTKFFYPPIPDKKIKDVFSNQSALTPQQIAEKVSKDEKFFLLCDKPTELLPLPVNVVNVNEAERVYPNIPRYGSNETDLAPIETTELAGVRDCYFQIQIMMDPPHGDGRKMWGFRHRQTGLTNVYDHNAKKEYICAPCLKLFFENTALSASHTIECFNPQNCSGHFHPSEIKNIVPDETYQAYKDYYNRNPPMLGGARALNKNYPPLFVTSEYVNQNSCPLPSKRKGGKRKTRKLRKMKKTRKAKHFGRTRKH